MMMGKKRETKHEKEQREVKGREWRRERKKT